VREWFMRKLVRPVLDLLRQGVTPRKIALSIALGMVIGVFPAIGWTTLLCFVFALALRLNLVAIQLVNYLMYPVQIALLLPFVRLGEFLFRATRLPLNLQQILHLVRADAAGAIRVLWTATWHAAVAWLVVAPLAVAALYFLLHPLLRIASARMTSRHQPETV
jgi:uncharacterized protein (DUF2062 family)